MESILPRSSEFFSLKKKRAQCFPFCCFSTASHPYRKGKSVASVSALAIGSFHAESELPAPSFKSELDTDHSQTPDPVLCLQGHCLSSGKMSPICSTKACAGWAARGQGVHPTPQRCRISLLSPPFPAVQ